MNLTLRLVISAVLVLLLGTLPLDVVERLTARAVACVDPFAFYVYRGGAYLLIRDGYALLEIARIYPTCTMLYYAVGLAPLLVRASWRRWLLAATVSGVTVLLTNQLRLHVTVYLLVSGYAWEFAGDFVAKLAAAVVLIRYLADLWYYALRVRPLEQELATKSRNPRSE